MGFLRRLFGGGQRVVSIDAWLMKPDRDDAELPIVGESFYQDALLRISGGRTPDSPRQPGDHLAVLFPEPDNRYDRNAIAVRIDGLVVGHLTREDAVGYGPVVRFAEAHGRKIACQAELIGGWDRGARDRGSIGVSLRLGTPMECMLGALDGTEGEIRPRTDNPWAGQLIAFTGDSLFDLRSVPLDRPSSALLAAKAGIQVHPRITKKVQLLVDCDPSGQSGNERRAGEYCIPVIPERDFWAALGVQVQERQRQA